MKIAIVTGASSGMGREFVYALDREGKYEEIWVIARRADRLESLKTECKTAIRPITLDLGKAESFDACWRPKSRTSRYWSTVRASANSAPTPRSRPRLPAR